MNFSTKLILILIIVAIAPNLYGQKKTTQIGSDIYILPTQLLFHEILLTYEHFIKDDISLSYSAGYKISNGKEGRLEPFGHGLFAVYEYQYMFNQFSKGIYSSIAPSYYFSEKRKFYAQAELFYRYY